MIAATGEPAIDALLEIICEAATDGVAEYRKLGCAPSLEYTSPVDLLGDVTKLKQITRALEGACEQLCSSIAPADHTVVNRALVAGYGPAALRLASEGQIADLLLDKPEGASIAYLAHKTGMDETKLSRVLRFLASTHCFAEMSSNTFANNCLSLTLVKSNPTSSFIGFLSNECIKNGASCMYDTLSHPDFSHSADPKRSPFMYSKRESCPDSDLFTVLASELWRLQRFGTGMIGWGRVSGSASVSSIYPFHTLHRGTKFCDVGSGVGAMSLAICAKHPHLQITLQDTEPTIKEAQKVWAEQQPGALENGRVTLTAMDFFQECPKGHDIYYIKNVLHNWTDDTALLLLRNVRKAMKDSSRVLIHELLLDHANGSDDAVMSGGKAPYPLLANYSAGSIRKYAMDMCMLSLLNSRERLLEEYVALAEKVGLRLTNVFDLAETSVLEFVVAKNCGDTVGRSSVVE